MARTNPLGKIKDLTVGTLKLPKAVTDKAVGQAKGAAATGLHVADQVARGAVSTVGSLVQQRRGATEPAPPVEVATEEARDDTAPDSVVEVVPDIDPDEPVNVVEELGLDPAPVETPKPAKKKAPAKKATTSIDAAADTANVDVTPADVAEKVTAKKPARRPAAKKAPAAKKTGAAKTTPSGKLPPRKAAEPNSDKG